ncbi:hypothetical protein M426DRAFT_23232 [Hypoxylon sp. CI-4A]|nr:hypothetical protein M426DRAFT_23232 [Hypoxylon sp. CI-4A]
MDSPSTWQMRAELSVAEHERRSGQDFIDVAFKGTILSAVHKLCDEHMLPTMSADYFHWYLDMETWDIVFKEKKGNSKPAFPFPAPEQYGSPYSEIYLSVLREKDMNAAVTSRLRKLEDIALSTPAHSIHHEVPSGTRRNSEFLVHLWETLFPGCGFENHCTEPFVVGFPWRDDTVYFHKCLARNSDELVNVMQHAAFLLGGREVVLSTIIKDRKSSKRIFLALDFSETANLHLSAVQYRFKRAWHDLLYVVVQWLRGHNTNIIDALKELNSMRLKTITEIPIPDMTKEYTDHKERVVDHWRRAGGLGMDDPERATKLQEFQVRHVRAVAEREAAGLATQTIVNSNFNERFLGVLNLVETARFGCLKKGELLKMGKRTATRLLEAYIDRELMQMSTIDVVKENFTIIVVDKAWDSIISSGKRLAMCKTGMLKHKLRHQSVDKWVLRTQARLDANQEQDTTSSTIGG